MELLIVLAIITLGIPIIIGGIIIITIINALSNIITALISKFF